MTTTHLPFWLAALHLPYIGPKRILRWLNFFSDIQTLFSASQEDLRAASLSEREIKVLKQIDWGVIEKELAWTGQPGCAIVTLQDAAYPSLLKQIPDPPLVLYVRGNVSALSQSQIAIVGSRHATVSGLKHAKQFAAELSQAGFTITSGLALGIDSACHRSVLEAKGCTVAVCGAGLHHIYPSTHIALAEAIVTSGGALISEFPLSESARPGYFPRRNRIISGLSLGVLVVEAGLKSGSLTTARHASEQGREVFAIPGPIHYPLSRGCHALIRQGAKLVENIQDILDELTFPQSSLALPSLETSPSLSTEQANVLKNVSHEITPLDMIHCRTGLTAGEVSSILLSLELNGYIRTVSGGYIRIV